MDNFIPGGHVLTARKIRKSGIWLKPPLYFKCFMWIVMGANHTDTESGGYTYKRGELVTTYDAIMKAMTHYHNRKRVTPSLKQIRVMLKYLEHEKMIEVNPLERSSFLTGADPGAETRAYVGIRIVVVNYDTYQTSENYKGRHRGRDLSSLGHNNNNEGKMNKKTPAEISDEITALKNRYPNQEIIEQGLQAIRSTRRSNRIKDTITLKILQSWDRHPIESVTTGIRTYLDKGCSAEGKKEEYLLGIIRNRTEAPTPEVKTCHSSVYDAYLKGELVPEVRP